MTKQSKGARAGSADAARNDVVRDGADALYRAAVECCRQRERTCRLEEIAASAAEQRAGLKLARLCDEQLVEAVLAYEKAAARFKPDGEQEWWHRANILWMASREYERRHRAADGAAKNLDDPTNRLLGAIAMDYDLEASAILALQQVLEDYRRCRPEAETTTAARGKRDGGSAGNRS